MPRPTTPAPAPAPSFVYKTKTLTRPLALLALLGGCSLQAASEPAPASVQTQTQALTPLTGIADLHLHMFGEEAFGGGWLHGSATAALNRCDGGLPPSSHARVRQDMRDLLKLCPSTGGIDLSSVPILAQIFAAGGGVTSELLAKTDATDGDTGLHLSQRDPGTQWPRWDSIAHQQSHLDWLKQAHAGGLRLEVISAVSNGFLCSALPPGNRKRACDEMVDVEQQLRLAQDFATANASWVEIAYSAADARRIIGAGKLALVLSLEVSKLFGSKDLRTELSRFYALGVRTLQPVHQIDNRFAGAALHQPIFHFAQFLETCHIDTDCGATSGGITLGFDVDKNCRNVKGLTAEGKTLVQEMMRKGMLIDIAHMSERSVADTFALAQANSYYPLYVSHGHPREVMGPDQAKNEKTTPSTIMGYIRQTGGLFGMRTFHDETRDYPASGVDNSCHGSSRSFAQALAFATKGLKVKVALGSDFNGFIQQVRPRFGDLGACSGGFRAEGDAQSRAQGVMGGGRLGTDYDEKGLAHIGLLPDFVRDLAAVGADTTPLYSSAEAFVQMWERASGTRTGMADPATDMDLTGISPYVAKATREATYPTQCGVRYAPASKANGQSCRFSAECVSGRCSALLCGSIPGRCY